MIFRISHIASFLILASTIIIGCKGSTTDSNGNNPPPVNIGDSIPQSGSTYTYQIAQLDRNGNIIVGTVSLPNHGAIVKASGVPEFGKSNAYFINDDGDSCYYAYETSNDVSIYLQNPGFIQSFPGYNTDLPLQTVLELVFHRWLTLPIATKDTGRILYNATSTVMVTGDPISTNILAKADYIGDSTMRIGGVDLLAKHCKISISAIFDQVRYPGKSVSHTRDVWFVPKIGYIAKIKTRTNVPNIDVLVVPTDTTAVEKTLASFKLN